VDGRDKPGHDGVGRRRIVHIAAVVSFAVLAVSGAVAAWVVSLGPLPLDQARQVSTSIVDRNGKLLRAYAMADGRWRLPVDARTGVDPGYLKLLLAYEDRCSVHTPVSIRSRWAARRFSSSAAGTSSPAARPSRCSWRD
jgi:penicillin-binding protein 1C